MIYFLYIQPYYVCSNTLTITSQDDAVSDVTTTVSVVSKMILPSKTERADPEGIGAPLMTYAPAAWTSTLICDVVRFAKLHPIITEVVADGTVYVVVAPVPTDALV